MDVIQIASMLDDSDINEIVTELGQNAEYVLDEMAKAADRLFA